MATGPGRRAAGPAATRPPWVAAALLAGILAACGHGDGADPGRDPGVPDGGEGVADPGPDGAPDLPGPDGRDVPADPGGDPGADGGDRDDAPDADARPGDPGDDPAADAPPGDRPGDGADDPGGDGAPDPGPADDGDPGPADPGTDGGCPVLACAEACPHGPRLDADGCPTCACLDCAAPDHCAGRGPCLHPWCDPDGSCTCDCPDGLATDYACPDGTRVPECACGPLGWSCVPHPEWRCPTLCRPGDTAALPCPGGGEAPGCACAAADCVPECRAPGTVAEGWYDPCTAELLRAGPCDGCRVTCRDAGTADEGWVESCGGARVGTAACAPRFACAAEGVDGCADPRCTAGLATWACPDGTRVPWCDCGGANLWSCRASPWEACPAPAPCTVAGGTYVAGAGEAGCCPGTEPVPDAPWDGAACGDRTGLLRCAACGDGECGGAESPCNCPRDCAGAAGAPGDACTDDGGCADGWFCLRVPQEAAVGACARACTVASSDCPAGTGCLAVPGLSGMAFCLAACRAGDACPVPLACGVPRVVPVPEVGHCWDWAACDPVANLGCVSGAQCRVVPGGSACGAAGNLKQLERCDPADDRCGPTFTCTAVGAEHWCTPVCDTDDWCVALGWTGCLHAPPGAPWGGCFVTG